MTPFMRRFAGRVAVTGWALAIVGAYVWKLRGWLSPSIVKWGLPFFGMASAPHIGGFLADTTGAVALVVVISGIGFGPGSVLARWLRLGDRRAGRIIPLGWVPVSMALLGLALTGCWFRGVIGVVILATAVLAARTSWPVRDRDAAADRWALWSRLDLAAPALLMGWMLLLTVLAPESFQDALRYHLFLPNQFLLAHKLFFVERYFFWSYLGPPHMLYGAGLALAGQRAARLVNVAMALLSLATLDRILVRAGYDRALRALALGLTVTAPGLQLITGSAFIEHAWALYVLLALETALAGPSPTAFVELGLWLGCAFSAKYTAVFGATGILLQLLLSGRRAAWIDVARGAGARCTALLMGVNLPWAALRWLATRDPLSPHLARAGFHTLDATSRIPLHVYYDFAAKSREAVLASPDLLIRYPLLFAGAHGGFWEHPGPAIAALLLAALIHLDRYPERAFQLVAFSAGSAAAWVAFCGGISPHYIMAIAGLWVAAAVGVLPALAPGARRTLWNVMAALVWIQAVLSFVAATYRFGPRDVAFGTMTPEAYLAAGLAPKAVHIPVRRDLERLAPRHGTVYVYGDDTSYYLSGRVFCDYENGCDPLLWRIAAASRTPAELRKRLRQRNWTHLIYSTRWPDALGELHELAFRFNDRTLVLVQAFWRGYCQPVAFRETPAANDGGGTYAFVLLPRPAPGLDNVSFPLRGTTLPGAEALVYDGDLALTKGDPAAAEKSYLARLARAPHAGLVLNRLAIRARARHDAAAAARWTRQARAVNWFAAPSR